MLRKCSRLGVDMKALRSVFLVAAVGPLGACGTTDITVKNLEGPWDATAYVYTNKANTSQQVDIVAVNGATMTLTVQASGTTASTFNDGQGNSSSNSGQFTAEGQALTLAGITYQASLDGDRLTLINGNAEYDFDANGSKDPATATIALTRR